MGNKDKTRDGDAATSTKANRDHSQDQEARDTALARTIAEAVANRPSQLLKYLQGKCQRLMHNIKTLSRRVALQPYRLPLKLLPDQMALESWTPLIGQWTRISIRDGNFCHTRLSSPLKLWKETQRRPKISYLHHWLNGEGISKIEGWKNS